MADIAPDILDRARQGDRQAFDDLVRFYRDDLLRVAYRFVGNYEDARDVLQLVFVKVHQNIDRWEPRAPFWSWLYRIVVNESLGWKKREQRRYGLITPAEEMIQSDAASPSPSPLEDAAWSETERRVLDAIDQLPEMQRATFVLRYREELSVKETAATLGCAEGTVKANGYHAIRRLRKILSEMESPAIELESDDTTALQYGPGGSSGAGRLGRPHAPEPGPRGSSVELRRLPGRAARRPRAAGGKSRDCGSAASRIRLGRL